VVETGEQSRDGCACRDRREERHLVQPLTQFPQHLPVLVVPCDAPQPLDYEPEDAVERDVGGELIVGDGELLVSPRSADLLRDPPLALERQQIVLDEQVAPARPTLPLLP
jgi:hypothetical protein